MAHCCRYLYKRLKWLGNKDASQLGTLVYLALWHGIHTGYFHNFFMEYIIMFAEKGVGTSLFDIMPTYAVSMTYHFY